MSKKYLRKKTVITSCLDVTSLIKHYKGVKIEDSLLETYKKDVEETLEKSGVLVDNIILSFDGYSAIYDTYHGFGLKNNHPKFSISHIKKLIKMEEIDENISAEKIYHKLFTDYRCCAFKEGRVLNFLPNGDIKNLIPQYKNEDFIVGNCSQDLEYIIDKTKEKKTSNAKWMQDENCLKCPKLVKCYGGCVERYENVKVLPSENCNIKTNLILDKMRLRQYLYKQEVINGEDS